MTTAKQKVLYYLQTHSDRWVSGYELESQSHDWGYTAGNITRRARELVESGAIERQLGIKKAVEYRVKRQEPAKPYFDPNELLEKLRQEEHKQESLI